jgi:hypothetical protein
MSSSIFTACSHKAQAINMEVDRLVEIIENFTETGTVREWASFTKSLHDGLEALDKAMKELRELDSQAPSTVTMASKKFHLLTATIVRARLSVGKIDAKPSNAEELPAASKEAGELVGSRRVQFVEDLRKLTHKSTALYRKAGEYQDEKLKMAKEQKMLAKKHE